VIIYEMDRNQNQTGAATTLSNSNHNGKPATVTSSLQTITSPISINGSTNNLGRLDSPAPVPKRFPVPFLKSPASENSALRNATLGLPSVPNAPTKINTFNSLSASNKPIINTAHCFEWTTVPSKSPPKSLVTTPLVDQQYGVKRKLEDVMEKKETAKLESKQPRLITSITTGTIKSVPIVITNKTNGMIVPPVCSTSLWKVIANGETSTTNKDKQSENFRKASSKSGGYCSDPETKPNSNSKHVDFHRAKSVERLGTSQTNKAVISLKPYPERDLLLNKSPEKLRKSPMLEINSHVNGFSQNGESKVKDVGSPNSVYTNGYSKPSDQKRLKIHEDPPPKVRQESSVSLLLEKKPSASSSSSDSSSDEKHKSKSSKHKKKAKKKQKTTKETSQEEFI